MLKFLFIINCANLLSRCRINVIWITLIIYVQNATSRWRAKGEEPKMQRRGSLKLFDVSIHRIVNKTFSWQDFDLKSFTWCFCCCWMNVFHCPCIWLILIWWASCDIGPRGHVQHAWHMRHVSSGVTRQPGLQPSQTKDAEVI